MADATGREIVLRERTDPYSGFGWYAAWVDEPEAGCYGHSPPEAVGALLMRQPRGLRFSAGDATGREWLDRFGPGSGFKGR